MSACFVTTPRLHQCSPGSTREALGRRLNPAIFQPGRTKPVRSRLDDIDLAILRELQRDGRMTNVELARRIGISPPPCLRRVRALEEAGAITGYRAQVDARRLGFELSCFAFVHLASQAEADLQAFQARVRGWNIVRECWTVSGEIDFILKCVAPSLAAFHDFVNELTATPNVRNVRTALTHDKIKDEPAAPL
jgi:DNA-binding Lrp family transcriptional regulator